MKKDRKGFTLVEAIVVIAVILLLVSVVVISMVQYQRTAQFRRQNEHARTLYNAAQLQLAQYSRLDALKELEASVGDYPVPLEKLRGSNGGSITAAQIWQTEKTSSQGRICYITVTAADYDAYRKGALSDKSKCALYELFDAYVYDKSILHAAICAELDPEEGLLYSVLYSEWADGFTYGADAGETVSIADRTLHERKQRMVGYYGVDTLTKTTSTQAQKPVIGEVKLDNGNMLTLSFRLQKLPEATLQLCYEAVLYDAKSKTSLLQITFNDSEAGNSLRADSSILAHTVSARVHGEGIDGEYLFPAWIDSEGRVSLVLDAVDLGATEKAFLAGELQNTFSLHRFGLQAESITCSIQGSGGGYKTTSRRESNEAQPYFGDYSVKDDSKTCAYTLSNARHLYNIRFISCDSSAPDTSFYLTQDISWREIIAAGDVYRKYNSEIYQRELLLDAETSGDAFVSVSQLRAGDRLLSTDTAKTISGLFISKERNDAVLDATEATGFFLKNNGEITNIAFDDIRVSGENNVGTLCGINAGILRSITVRNTDGASFVTGVSDVGGITGSRAEGRDVYEELENHAAVTGVRYVGGIIGRVRAQTAVTLDNCRNFGKVLGSDVEGLDAQYIGGITGYAEAVESGELTLQSCVSSSQYTQQELEEVKLQGTYVGGIVGRIDGAQLVDCSTVEKDGVKGYVLGKRYVGGIAGYCSGSLNGKNTAGKSGYNRANVLAESYAGGIVGVNAELIGDNEVGTEAVENSVSNWVNEGLVLTESGYAGGIAGYNTGSILNCGSEVSLDATAEKAFISERYCGDYAGGLAGYNNGVLQADIPTELRTAVNGGNYTGGIVGYNDIAAEIDNYVLAGGHIRGKLFTGGFAGLNTAAQLVNGTTLRAAPDSVEGSNCVAGVLGGNILVPGADIGGSYEVSNPTGTVSGELFTGGFIGFQQLARNPVQLKQILENTFDILSNTKTDLSQKATQLRGSTESAPTAVYTVSDSSCELKSITGQLYVGGLLGFHQSGSFLCIKASTSRTPVTALSTVTALEQGEEVRFAYAGGVTGLVGEGMLISGCRSEGSVTSSASYSGGITELNRSLIVRCSAANISGDTLSGIGGIAGLNAPLQKTLAFSTAGYVREHYGEESFIAADGSFLSGIYECALRGNLNGHSNVGGIAAVNSGVIAFPMIDGSISADGTAIGGVAGRNTEMGVITLSTTAKIDIDGDGSCVGGLIGINRGKLLISADSNAATSATASGKTISGADEVGGLIGRHEGESLSGLVNGAAVTASNGSCGGIAGTATGSGLGFVIENCANHGPLKATVDAGGITKSLGAGYTLRRCINSGEILAQNGNSGGIVAVNSGTLQGCAVCAFAVGELGGSSPSAWLAEQAYGGIQLEICGGQAVGAVAGINDGTVSGCAVRGIRLQNDADLADSKLGGLVGLNRGSLLLGNDSLAETELLCLSGGSSAGGLVGRNEGSIGSATGEMITIGDSADTQVLRIELDAAWGNLGGAAGSNSGVITQCVVYASITGGRGNGSVPENGYGGVVGHNEGTVDNCSFNGSVAADGSKKAPAAIGGIAGRNTGTLRNCLIAEEAATRIACGSESNGFGYAGGFAGKNEGSIHGEEFKTRTQSVDITVFGGYAGGIAGYNDENGTVGADSTLSSGLNWVIETLDNSGESAAGGILGCSLSGADINSIENYATVKGGSSGGLIGVLINRQRKSFRISDCHNYGCVYGSGFCGGFIGQWQGFGGLIEQSGNYGSIGKAPVEQCPQAAAGFVAAFGDMKTEVQLNACSNYGEIRGSSNAAGLTTGGSKDTVLLLSDCRNTGCVFGTASDGSFAGISAIKDGCRASFIRCRNYGNVNTDCIDAFSGICNGTAAQSMSFSFHYGNAASVFGTAVTAQDNYYVAYSSEVSSKEGIPLKPMSDGGGYQLYDALRQLTTIKALLVDPVGKGAGTAEDGTDADSLSYVEDFSLYEDFSATAAPHSYRYRVIRELEPKLEAFYRSLSTEKPTLSDIRAEEQGSTWLISWESDKQAYAYEVSYAIDDVAKLGDKIYSTNMTEQFIDSESSWSGKSIVFYVRAVYWEEGAEGNLTKAYTAWLPSDPTPVKMLLPVPQIQLLLTGTENNSYRVMLLNTESYKDEAGNALDATIACTIGDVSVHFKVSRGESENVELTKVGSSFVTLRAQADTLTKEQQATYTDSAEKAMQTDIYTAEALKKTDVCQTSFIGFDGDSSDTLRYTLQLSAENAVCGCELLAYDEVLQCYVAAAWTEAAVSDEERTVALSDMNSPLTSRDGELIVRTYLLSTQDKLSCFGYEVASDVTAEELSWLKDGNTAVYNEAAGFTPGYLAQKNEDATYRIMYSTMLAFERVYAPQIYTLSYTVDTKGGRITGQDGTEYPVSERPLLNAAYTYIPETDSCRFSWDTGRGFADARYALTFTGIFDDGSELLLGSAYLASYNPITDSWFTDWTEDGLSFARLRLCVERIGTAENNATVCFPAQAEAVFDLPERLPQQEAPKTELYEAVSATDYPLIYRVSWTGIQEPELLRELSDYEITVSYKDSGTMRKLHFRTKDSLSELNGLLENSEPQLYADSAQANTAFINLNCLGYLGKSEVYLSVRAIASAEAVACRNSSEGVTAALLLPPGMATPELSKLVYVADSVMSVKDFTEKGVRFEMAQDYPKSGSYEMTAELVRRTQSGGYEHLDYIFNEHGEINSGNPLRMQGGLDAASLTLTGLSADYAGNYVRVALRAVSENLITSAWSFADTGIPYAVFRLPSVQVELPEVIEQRCDIVYDTGKAEDVLTLSQSALQFETVEYAGSYLIDIICAPQPAGYDLEADCCNVIRLRLEKAGDSFEVFCLRSDSKDNEVSLGVIQEQGLLLPYSVTAGADAIEVLSRLYFESGRLTLVLPDCDTLGIAPTDYVTVQALADNEECYVDSAVCTVYRFEGQFVSKSFEETLPAPSGIAVTATLSAREDTAYELSIPGNSRYLVKLTAADFTRCYSVPFSAGLGSLLLLGKMDWEAYAGAEIQIQLATLTKDRGVSLWSNAILITLPLPTPEE